MTAWVELFRDSPGACICLVLAAGIGVSWAIAAIRRSGGM